MKNNIYKYLFILSTILFAISCTDLEEEPVGILAPEGLFKTPSEVEAAVMGAYGQIASEQFYGRKLTLTTTLRSDMVGMTREQGRRSAFDNFSLDANNALINALWPKSWQIIAASNLALTGANIVGEPQAEIDALRGEARFIRAFTYYHIVRLFGEVPLIDEVLSENASTLGDLPKSSIDDIYTFIIEDLKFAKENLPDSWENLRTRATKGTAASYLASVYLTLASENNTLGTYQQAYTEAKWVIDREGDFGYSLMPDFQDLYLAANYDNMPEHVFSVDFKSGVTVNNVNTDWMPAIFAPQNTTDEAKLLISGFDRAGPNIATYTTWDNRDYRKEVSLLTQAFSTTIDPQTGTNVPTLFNGTTLSWEPTEIAGPSGPISVGLPGNKNVPYVKKYWGNRTAGQSEPNSGQTDINYPVMRYAEVLLIAAESIVMGGGGSQDDAVTYINRIRKRARDADGTVRTFPMDITTSSLTRDLVIDDRRLELAFEFKRWYDIKRLKLGDEVFGPTGLDPQPAFDPNRDYLFPIPQNEIDRNSNLLPQNPGY